MTNVLTQLSDAISGAIAAADRSIVRIDGARRSPATGIAYEKDLVVTAAHVLRSRDGVTITRNDGETFPASIAGGDSGSDLAVLRVEGAALQAIAWTDRETRTGDVAIVAGRPGRTVRAAIGVVSAVGGEWRAFDGTRIDRYIDVDASLPRGFSGGPLLDGDGAAIGINTSGVTRGGTTIPHQTVKRIVDELLSHGSIRRPLLGIGVYPVEEGLLVMSVKEGSGAASGGILVGDVIRSIDGTEVHSPRRLHALLQNSSPGKQVVVEFTRGGEKKSVTLTIGSA